MNIKGRTWKFGRNINTDLIFPSEFFRPSYEPGEMASRLMTGVDAEFPSKVKKGDIIVGAPNFGCGSSREEAAASMREAEIAAVVAPSFGRIFTRNCINLGIPIVACLGIDEHIEEGDEIEIDLVEGVIRNHANGYEAKFPCFAPELLSLLNEGGIASYTRRIMAQREAAAVVAQRKGA